MDELLLLTDQLNKKKKHQFRMIMLGQGHDIDDEDGQEGSGEDLPEEVLAAERAFKAERERKRAESGGVAQFAEGLGYQVVS